MTSLPPNELSLALLGSGEFEPWSNEVDLKLLGRASGDGSVLILPTASAPEGDSTFNRWGEMGIRHFASLGVAAEVLPLKTRADADLSGLASKLRTASMAYFSGGNPAYLASALAGSLFWKELLEAMRRGMAYTGCSAGIACLGEVAVDSAAHMRGELDVWRPGLGLFRDVHLAPHWDGLDRYQSGLQARFIAAVPPGRTLVAIDENTSMVGDGERWEVYGAGAASIHRNGEWRTFRPGQSFDDPLPIALGSIPAKA